MIVKCFEVRDANTFIPVVAIQLQAANPQQKYLLRRAGFVTGAAVIVSKLVSGETHHDPFGWPDQRTMRQAHRHIVAHFDKLKDGDVVDVAFILGETAAPAVSERVTRETVG